MTRVIFQISVPIQPGNSGGALVDERGNVVGVVSAKLNAWAALSTSGSLPENVNYAVKSSFLLGFLESVPAVSAKLKEPGTKELRFENGCRVRGESSGSGARILKPRAIGVACFVERLSHPFGQRPSLYEGIFRCGELAA